MNAALKKIWTAKHHLAIIALAIALLLPAALSPPMLRDSFWIDWVWSDQFTPQLARGNLYPRWLPLSDGGAGSAAFYFYPPIAFYVSGVLGLLRLSTYAAVIGCFGLGLVLSGYTMFVWLRGAPQRLIGTLLFMAAPYHIYDFYGRGAQAEFFAIGWIPLVAFGLRRAKEHRPALLAVAYAALILTHLPLALLVSLFLIAPWCIWHGEWRWFALPLALGLAMAAIYLIPALALDKYRDTAPLWADPAYHPENWSLVFWHAGPRPGMRTLFAIILVSSLMTTTILWFGGQKKISLYAAGCCIVAAGVVPAIWALPILKNVQFPFRLLPLVEFALATGVASARLPGRLLLLAASPTLTLTPIFAVVHPQGRAPSVEWLATFHPDVRENRLVTRKPLPEWPERAGFLISLAGLALTAGFSLRRRRPARPAQSPICSRTT